MPLPIFVFGSNLAGRHGAGAALHARTKHGAQYGVGVGLTGCAYALPTKDASLRSLPLAEIQRHVDDFLSLALRLSNTPFHITRVGCGLAGFTDTQIRPMFANAPSNCYFYDPSWGQGI